MKKVQKRLKRSNGIILPIFSIPSNYGIGTFGKEAYDVVDFLSEASIKYRQILPLGPTSYGDSPYQSFSSFAGNPYFIDLDKLVEDGLLDKKDLDNLDFGDDKRYVDYARQYNIRYRILEKAFENSKGILDSEIDKFREKESDRLEDYALFMAIKRDKLDVMRTERDEKLKNRDPKAISIFKKDHKDLIDLYIFIQYEFFTQWEKLKKYTNRRKIEIIGDLPIYIALDSADSWVNQDILQLDPITKAPIVVGGAPPDNYSDEGQLRGNPLYDRSKMKENGFSFWIKRIKMALRLYDVLRLDHFRGFEKYYAIPYEDDNAKFGTWEKAFPYEFFDTILKNFPDAQFIAEDLGFITKEVEEIKDHYGFPGMNVIEFAFGSTSDNLYLPHNYWRNSIVYSSTHDSDTLLGWLDEVDKDILDEIIEYFGISHDDDYSRKIIRNLMESVSDVAIFQMQDFLEVGSYGRINNPGTMGENRKWRAQKEDFKDDLAIKISKMARVYGRSNG